MHISTFSQFPQAVVSNVFFSLKYIVYNDQKQLAFFSLFSFTFCSKYGLIPLQKC